MSEVHGVWFKRSKCLKKKKRRRDTRFLENEKLTLANQNEIKFKSQGKFFKTHTKSVYIIYS